MKYGQRIIGENWGQKIRKLEKMTTQVFLKSNSNSGMSNNSSVWIGLNRAVYRAKGIFIQ